MVLLHSTALLKKAESASFVISHWRSFLSAVAGVRSFDSPVMN
jgi:hypothetical protein